MSFPVDMLNNYSHLDLESSGQRHVSELRWGDPDHPEFLTLPDHSKIPISLSTVGFVPLYGEEQTHKVLALFAPKDSLTAVALYLAGQWWSIDDIVRTSVPDRQGIHQVKSVGERIVLYVLNRVIYRTQEMERNEIPFLCHGSKEYAKIMWKKGEAIGFYSVKPKGSICSATYNQNYTLPVLYTMFVRKKHRGKDSELKMLEDFVNSFTGDALGLRYPLSSLMFTACRQYLEKYPGNHNLLWEVSGAGFSFQRTSIVSKLQRERVTIAAEDSQGGEESVQAEVCLQSSATVSEASGQNTEQETHPSAASQRDKESTDACPGTSKDPNITPVSIRIQGSYLKRPKIGKNHQESEPGTSQGGKQSALRVSKIRLELRAHTSEDLVEVPENNTVETNEETIVENEGQSVSEAELHVSPSERRSEEETPSEPLNSEVTEETGETSLVAEEETGDEVLSSESQLEAESQEETSILAVPLIHESSAESSEDTALEKVLNASDSEVLTEGGTVVEEGGTEEHQEAEKTTPENAVASASKEDACGNELPSPMVTEAAEESVSENLSPKTSSSLEDQNEEAGPNSQEAPVAVGQSSLIVVELEGFSFQQPSGQEEQKNQLEEHSESTERMDQYTQTAAEQAADSSSEEAEIEVPIVDRRSLRRKAKGYKGPAKKKGKPA